MNPLESLQKFHSESISILALRAYLYSIETEVIKGNKEIGKTHKSVMEKIYGTYQSPHDYVMSSMFISHVGAFEFLMQDLIRFALKKHPKRMGSKKFTLLQILEMSSTQDLIEISINEYINSLMYQKPLDYLKDISEILGFDAKNVLPEWRLFVEAKARRDLGVHNRWTCNQVYLDKITESGLMPKAKVGESMLPLQDDYLSDAFDAIYNLGQKIVELTVATHGLDSIS